MACITLLSDFGLQDATIASVKGILWQSGGNHSIIDISHQVEPYHLQQAAYLLNNAYPNFATGSFHIVLCDIFSDPAPKLLLCKKDGQYFFAPDNGILSLAFNNKYDVAWQCASLQPDEQIYDWILAIREMIEKITNTEALALEEVEMSDRLTHWQPSLIGNTLSCHVMHIDRFENVIINVTKAVFEQSRQGKNFSIAFARHTIREISNGYADVKQDDMLCRFNAAGYMEIAINRGKAASLLGLKLDKEQHLVYNTIKIVFE